MDVLSVLVVDDDAAMAAVTARLLREQGYEVRTALSGRQALDDLAERSADIVVLDLEMPEMSGAQTLTAIRSDPALAATRVVLYTGYVEVPELADDVRPDAMVTKVEGPRFLLAAVLDLA